MPCAAPKRRPAIGTPVSPSKNTSSPTLVITTGQVPHCGRHAAFVHALADASKPDGARGICDTHQRDRSRLKRVADWNIEAMFVTRPVFQRPMSWSNAAAPWNVDDMFATLAVFHVPIGWLNAAASWNAEVRSVTLAVFHAPMSWLKTVAPRNIHDIVVTFPVFHAPSGWLKAFAA